MSDMLGMRIKERRKQKGFTLKQVEQLTGISNGNLSEIERGIKTPALPSLIKLVNVLECSADDLIFGESESGFMGSKISVSERELTFLSALRQLDIDDQDEIMDLIEVKIRRKKRLARSLNSKGANASETA